MNHIKDNWSEGEVLHASDLNNIARAINGIIDEQASLVNDEVSSDSSAYSSNKTISTIEESRAALINDDEASESSIYSSSKIEDKVEGVKLKTVMVDSLPDEGEENTMYFTPAQFVSRTGYVMPSAPIPFYKDGDDIIMDSIHHEIGESGGYIPSVGDVIKYKKPVIDTTTQTFLRTYILDDSTTYPALETGTTFFEGRYNVGETFKVTSNMGRDFIITSHGDITIQAINYIEGITGYAIIEAGKVYRLTGYEQIPDENITFNEKFTITHDTFVATFEEVVGETSADHETQYLGSIFTKNKPNNLQYVIATNIDGEDIRIDGDTRGEKIVLYNISQTTPIQDGHYYRVKDSYVLKIGSNIEVSEFLEMLLMFSIGIEVLVYEEVSQPIDYIENDIVPFVNLIGEYRYKEDVSFPMPGYKSGAAPDTYSDNSDYVILNFPQDIKNGEIVKITKDNTGHNDNPYVCATEINSSELEYKEGGFYGITNSQEWAKNEYYRFTGYHKVKLPEGYPSWRKYVIPTFEKITGTISAKYEVEALPLTCIVWKGDKNAYDKWMWIEDGWEYIGN